MISENVKSFENEFSLKKKIVLPRLKQNQSGIQNKKIEVSGVAIRAKIVVKSVKYNVFLDITKPTKTNK